MLFQFGIQRTIFVSNYETNKNNVLYSNYCIHKGTYEVYIVYKEASIVADYILEGLHHTILTISYRITDTHMINTNNTKCMPYMHVM